MVVIFAWATADTGTEQERTASPSTWTVHAPHCATPQPYLVPVRPTCSRSTHSSGVSGSTCTSRTRPLMLSFAMDGLRGGSASWLTLPEGDDHDNGGDRPRTRRDRPAGAHADARARRHALAR